MSDIAIHVDRLSKRYRRGTSEPYHRLSEALANLGRAALRASTNLWHERPQSAAARQSDVRAPASRAADDGEYWALRDVSFEVKEGEVLGIIGRNGAGKSTLLKILSRITQPTSGRFGLRGRVASLLEVGTGFHPELTGRENIELSGTLLGMTRREIRRHFDEIVAFAEIEPWLDTPVKRYSSGMYVRLGFAVAAHLAHEILIVDEVLAVGDAAFQKKCLGKMSDVARGGRTVLFVSHNMAAVQHLCSRGMLIESGHVAFDGDSLVAVERYSSMSIADGPEESTSLIGHPGRAPRMKPILTSVTLLDADAGGPVGFVSPGDDVVVEIGYDCGGDSYDFVVIAINSMLGDRLITVSTSQSRDWMLRFEGRGAVRCRLHALRLAPGDYSMLLAVGRQSDASNADLVANAAILRVADHDVFGTGAALLPGQGCFIQPATWDVAYRAEDAIPASCCDA